MTRARPRTHRRDDDPDATAAIPERADVDAAVARILARADDGRRRVAVVGLSDQPSRSSHGVARALQAHGWDVVPVNPDIDAALGVPAVDALADVEGHIDLVDVFRRAEHLPGVAAEAAAVGATAVWNQLGLRSAEAAAIASEAGMDYVEDRCLKIEIARRR